MEPQTPTERESGVETSPAAEPTELTEEQVLDLVAAARQSLSPSVGGHRAAAGRDSSTSISPLNSIENSVTEALAGSS